MIRLLLPAVLMALSSISGPLQAPTERGAGRIFLDAVAVDGKGMPVMDLKPTEVEVWIGHFRVPIESFTVVTPAADPSGGRFTVLVLDDVTLPVQLMGRVKDVARHFVNKMQPGDRMAIVTLDGSEMASTNDRARLLQTIEGYNMASAGLIPIDRVGLE